MFYAMISEDTQLHNIFYHSDLSQISFSKLYFEAGRNLYASLNWVIIGCGNDVLSIRRQAIRWTNDDVLWIGPQEQIPEIGIKMILWKKNMH